MTTKEEVTEMRVDKVRVDRRSAVESPTFANDIETDLGMKMMVITRPVLHENAPSPLPLLPLPNKTLRMLTCVYNNTRNISRDRTKKR